jgi:hypothetical protein
MKIRHLIPVVALGAATVIAPVAQAQKGSDATAKATFLGPVKTKGKTATLRVKYQCSKGAVLWISAKQTKSAKKAKSLTKEGSSKVSSAWLQSHRNKITCDGKAHTTVFKLDKVEKGSKGTLRKGEAWIQFCVTQGEHDLTLSKSGWVHVKKA